MKFTKWIFLGAFLLVVGFVVMNNFQGSPALVENVTEGSSSIFSGVINANTLPPFQLKVTGSSQLFLPSSAFHCPTYALPNEPPEPKLDGPDAPLVAFRDATGLIHLFVAGGFNFAFTGTSFDNLTQNCNSVYVPHFNSDPSQYQYAEWLRAPYSVDGTHIYGIVHDEYHCATAEPNSTSTCVYEALTQVSSDDGGYTFTDEPMPQRLVATVPYQTIPNLAAIGVGDNSNIIKNPNDGYYYMEAIDHSGVGPCMFRSSDLNTWYAWNGASFSVLMNDPTAYDQPKSSYSCASIFTYPMGGVSELRYVPQYNLFLGVGGMSGSFYYVVSSDLVHWSAPVFLFPPDTFNNPLNSWRGGEPLPVDSLYSTLIDPNSQALNFDTISSSDQFYLYVIQAQSSLNAASVPVYRQDIRDIVEYPINFSSSTAAPQVASAPTFNVAAGSYGQTQTIALSCSNPSSVIYYTTNGNAPSPSIALSNFYSGPLHVSSTQTIKAICVAANYGISSVSSAKYSITLSASPPDTTPPTASIMVPTAGATVSGTVSVIASSSDNVGVTKAEFYVDGMLNSTEAESPYDFSLHTNALTNGPHTLAIKAYDAAGNAGTSPTIIITVDNPVQAPTSTSSFAIRSITISDITQTSARITVVTNASSSIVVGYSSTDSGNTTQPSPYLTTTYVDLGDLDPDTLYRLHVVATEASGTQISSGKYTFTTLAVAVSMGGGEAGGGSRPLPPGVSPTGVASSIAPLGPITPTTTSLSPLPSLSIASSPSSTLPFPRILKLGDTGSDVVLLQNILKRSGFLSVRIPSTGYFGTATKHALMLFQGAHDLAITGSLTPQSQVVMDKVAETVTTSPNPSGTFSTRMDPGSSGLEVKELQTFLVEDGDYPEAIISGYYGSLTEKAVQGFQSKYGIISYGSPKTTGYGAVGLKTLLEINSLIDLNP